MGWSYIIIPWNSYWTEEIRKFVFWPWQPSKEVRRPGRLSPLLCLCALGDHPLFPLPMRSLGRPSPLSVGWQVVRFVRYNSVFFGHHAAPFTLPGSTRHRRSLHVYPSFHPIVPWLLMTSFSFSSLLLLVCEFFLSAWSLCWWYLYRVFFMLSLKYTWTKTHSITQCKVHCMVWSYTIEFSACIRW